jgi:type IV pilus assembly protein PilO
MTYSEDLMTSSPLDTDTYLDQAPTYPSIFGIDLSPMLLGGVLAVIGFAGAGYFGYTNLMPQQQANQELQMKLSSLQQQIQERQDNAKKIAEAKVKLEKAKVQQQAVLALFANDQKLDTLLLDLNKLINTRQGELQKFNPDAAATGVINDGSLGSALNGKLRRKSTDVEVDGSFEQMQSILRTVERLDQLLILKDFQADLVLANTNNLSGGGVISSTPKIKTKFKLQAVIPLTAEESAAAAAPPPAAAK